ncbi:hypothetical protein [Sphingomonas oligophenolica]|uniref:Uncharacterized protein n=1 Tax=Sphingomonas oligophenolica TaxID=301154 RepID=A0A502CE35_9SPHN|nr:hypothetical protein [Sphingomonas oligophenolica]TPG09981.1 hypothetical protein EAH84_12765 [Sphingomonas oligophenolica]
MPSRLALCVDAAPVFLLEMAQARTIIDAQIAIIRARFDATCDDAGISAVDRELLRDRQFLNLYAFEGYV